MTVAALLLAACGSDGGGAPGPVEADEAAALADAEEMLSAREPGADEAQAGAGQASDDAASELAESTGDKPAAVSQTPGEDQR